MITMQVEAMRKENALLGQITQAGDMIDMLIDMITKEIEYIVNGNIRYISYNEPARELNVTLGSHANLSKGNRLRIKGLGAKFEVKIALDHDIPKKLL